jgi:two-component system cell cycle sensor histidine kinase/response regulator CckA
MYRFSCKGSGNRGGLVERKEDSTLAKPVVDGNSQRAPGLSLRTDREDSPELDSLIRFAGGIAHDFNNLLTVINGYSEMLLEGKTDPVLIRDYLQEIWCAGNKAADIVEMILAFAGKPAIPFQMLDVNRMVEGMRDFLAATLGQAFYVNLGLCKEAMPVSGNPARLKWALANIIQNAKEAMPSGGRLEVWTRRLAAGEGGFRPDEGAAWGEIGVRDTGRGMDEAELKCVFEPYFSTKKCVHKPGLGLGLACTQGIVRQLGGRIRAESAPGAGTAFRILLPLALLP